MLKFFFFISPFTVFGLGPDFCGKSLHRTTARFLVSFSVLGVSNQSYGLKIKCWLPNSKGIGASAESNLCTGERRQ